MKEWSITASTRLGDGGRREHGFKHEKNDCTVRALVNAYKISYPDAHAKLKAYGRKDGGGCYNFPGFMKNESFIESEEVGFVTKPTENGGFRKTWRKSLGTLQAFVKKNPTGTFVIRVKGHALCVKNGLIHDSFVSAPRTQILGWWRVK